MHLGIACPKLSLHSSRQEGKRRPRTATFWKRASRASRSVFLRKGRRNHAVTVAGPKFETGAESEAGTDAWIGGAIGLAAGMIAVVLPGIGALIAAGPIAGAIGGMGIGAAAGGIVGLLKDHGVPEEEVAFYEKGLRRGGALIAVNQMTEDEATVARDILEQNGAADIEKLADEWRKVPQV